MNEQANSKLRALSDPIFICLLLFAMAALVYWPVRNCEFIDYDDPGYFSSNAHVLGGWTWSNVRWAFTNDDAANWHPLTWLSLMLDAEFFGKGPAGPHFTNLLFHAANTVLLFLWLRCLTSAMWRSAMVAALFALHPLHVESVAWVAERKDVLSVFFEFLSLLAYARWARTRTKIESQESIAGTMNPAFGPRSSTLDYSLALFFFACALMSKPMAVTLPFLLLLLDWWPLKRFNVQGSGFAVQNLILEKIPFFALSAISCVITFFVQQKGGAVATLTKFSMLARVENAFVSYARYLGKTIWPAMLANPYPHPGFWPPGLVLFAILLFIIFTCAVFWLRRSFPCAIVGWFWFVGTLIPVIGLVQVGGQSMADRYAYLPVVGIFIILVWGVAEACARWRFPKRATVLLCMIVLAACAARTRNQLSFWKNDGTLFSHALAVTKNNYIACVNLGTWFSKNGQIKEALDCYDMALQMSPSDPSVLYDVANAFAKLGHWDEAVENYRRALQITPDQPDILDNLGFALAAKGQFADAVTNFQSALKLKPDSSKAHNNLATVLFRQGKFQEAGRHFYEALRLEPDNPRLCVNLGDTLVKMGNIKAAAECYQQALQLEPDNAAAKAKLQALALISN